MYVLDEKRTSIPLKDRRVLTLIQSINLPMIAAADYPAEETQAFVITLQANDESLETYIYLHLSQTNQCVLYSFSEIPFLADRMEEAETEALDFVESMGFIMDNLRFHKLSAAEKNSLQKELPVFYPKLANFAPVLAARKKERPSDEIPAQDEEGFLEGQGFNPSSPTPDLGQEPDEVVDASQFGDVVAPEGSDDLDSDSEMVALKEMEARLEKLDAPKKSQPHGDLQISKNDWQEFLHLLLML